MGKIEKFSSESDLLQRIDQLKEEGVGESDLQVISEDRLDDNSLDYTDVKVKNSRGSFSDKITALFSGESAEERVLSSLNVPEEELDGYKQELNNGKILLYVDNDNISDTENYDSDHLKTLKQEMSITITRNHFLVMRAKKVAYLKVQLLVPD